MRVRKAGMNLVARDLNAITFLQQGIIHFAVLNILKVVFGGQQTTFNSLS